MRGTYMAIDDCSDVLGTQRPSSLSWLSLLSCALGHGRGRLHLAVLVLKPKPLEHMANEDIQWPLQWSGGIRLPHDKLVLDLVDTWVEHPGLRLRTSTRVGIGIYASASV